MITQRGGAGEKQMWKKKGGSTEKGKVMIRGVS